jgi:hypothetical protein
MPALPEAAPPMPAAEKIRLTPALATKLLEANSANRPLSDAHVNRIAAQIRGGKWRFNGDTIKIGVDGSVLDGQHRLWAVIEADTPVETFLATGIERGSFATIDAVRRLRTRTDVLALAGTGSYRRSIATALFWLLHWERGTIANYRDPKARVENSDVETAFGEHPGMAASVERATRSRDVANPGLLGVLYYVLAKRSPELGERMMSAMEDPTSLGVTDPFFRMRAVYLMRRGDAAWTIAIGIKAANAAARGQKVKDLRFSGKSEKFPELEL